MSNRFSWDIRIKGFGPFAAQTGGSMELADSRVAMYAANGQGKTCVSRLFRVAEAGASDLNASSINRGCNEGSFTFTVKDAKGVGKSLTITYKRGEEFIVSNATDHIFHVFNSDFVRDNLAASHYSPTGDAFNGYIVGKENIDVSEKREKLDELKREGQRIRAEIEHAVQAARTELANLKLKNLKRFKELTTEKILEMPLEGHNYDGKRRELDALVRLPDNVPQLAGLSFPFDMGVIDEAERLLKTRYTRDDFAEDFIRNVTSKRRFVEAGLKLLDGDKCPFCGTPFNSDARKLIESYEAYVQGQEAKTVNALETCIQSLESLRTSYGAFVESYQGRSNWLARLKPAFPVLEASELPSIPSAAELNAAADSVVGALRDKIVDISVAQDYQDAAVLRNRLQNLGKSVADANNILAKLDQSVMRSSKALTNTRQGLCAEMAKKVRSDCDSLIVQRASISSDYQKLQNKIRADEAKGKRLKRDVVAETLATLIHTVFGNKYSFDPTQFTIKLGETELGGNADAVMSDGEKSVLAFCYYVASTWNLLDAESESDRLFFVIDDPISSMDFHYVYSIAQIIRDLKARFSLSRVRFLLLTHNTAFFNLLARNKIAADCFTLHNGTIEKCKSRYLAPYGEHLKDLYGVALKETEPTHTTGNSIRQVIETLWRFNNPAAGNLGDYLGTSECYDLRECEYVYTLCQDMSHGATPFDREQPPDDEAVRRACWAVLCHVHRRFPGQLISLGIDLNPDDIKIPNSH